LFFPFIHFMVGILGAQPKADAIIGMMVMRADHERLEEIAAAKWASPSARGLLSAIMTDPNTEIVSRSQLRASDEKKARLPIGSRFPSITVEITPQMYDREEVRLHIEITSSLVKQTLNLGGIQAPVVEQNRSITDQRLRDGDVDILNGWSKAEDSRAFSGIPGLVYVPVLGKSLFGTGNTEKDLLVAVTAIVVRW
jgi:type II secretory pathway component GspD/PulD (secretin)